MLLRIRSVLSPLSEHLVTKNGRDPWEDSFGKLSEGAQYAASFQSDIDAYHHKCGGNDEKDGKSRPYHRLGHSLKEDQSASCGNFEERRCTELPLFF